ncbi:hypothetical protein ABVK25_007773 [Lepraria finkii]|uniref:Uncharacterized protein n=1 Tax=Lepraria finkii TaxID=1340010 RepID=A0ABR4B388_9LECA
MRSLHSTLATPPYAPAAVTTPSGGSSSTVDTVETVDSEGDCPESTASSSSSSSSLSTQHNNISTLLHLLFTPLLLFLTLTTTIAISTLSFRAFIVYAELTSAVLLNWINCYNIPKSTQTPSKFPTPIPSDPQKPSHHHKSRHRRSSCSSSGTSSSTASSNTLTPKAPDTTGTGSGCGFGIYTGAGVVRDFEGVGGWRITNPDDDANEEKNRTALNSRLELPATVRHHHRSRTSGSVASVSVPPKSPGLQAVGG